MTYYVPRANVLSSYLWDTTLADRGDAAACVKAGYRYLHGVAAKRDERKAAEYFRKAGPRVPSAVAWLCFMEVACRKKPFPAS
ncbi:MAG TPA: SEL1-like repeat protein, partial [Bryobacteraceae bacterium]|nr:SEL1-like repeat protein [Bryobacteraceae bacterium]